MNNYSFEGYPSALPLYCEMQIVESKIKIYSGLFSLKSGNKQGIQINGEVFYSLEGDIKLEFRGVGTDFRPEWIEKGIQIITQTGLEGEGIITLLSDSKSGEVTYWGELNRLFSQEVACTRWHWAYINVPSFFGDNVIRIDQQKRKVCADRLTFTCGDGTTIIMEKAPDTNEKKPWQISHICELSFQKGKALNYSKVIHYIYAFTHFISFVVGRYHAPIFIQGDTPNTQSFQYHYNGYDCSRVGVLSWRPSHHDKDIIEIWPKFESIWNGLDRDKADILSTALHWYLEANMGSGKMEGAFIMAMTGIQMMWNVILDKKERKGNKQLQCLLNKMNYTPSFEPKKLIDTRNYLVHYDEENRKRYNELSWEQKFLLLDNALNILELVILFWLGYNGRYTDRTNTNKWTAASIKRVPWAAVPEAAEEES